MTENQLITDQVRNFNRFYTQKIGILQQGLLNSEFSLTEVRVMYELIESKILSQTELAINLNLDFGYLSRILRKFEKRSLIIRTPSPTDARQKLLQLSESGKIVFSELNDRSNERINKLLEGLTGIEKKRLLKAMDTIRYLLNPESDKEKIYFIRHHQPGDLGWITYRHGVLYSEEYHWNNEFESLVAGIASNFLKNFNSARECCWIAEQDGEIVGSICIAEESKTTANFRLFYVEPKTRGMGIGKHLVHEALSFCKNARYKNISLWTYSNLEAARKIYQKSGFKLVNQKLMYNFGQQLTGETWELNL